MASRLLFRRSQFIKTMTTKRSFSLSGIYPPIATPFSIDESVAWEKLQKNIKKLNGFELAGYLVQGSNGEVFSLSEDERIETVRVVKEAASPDKKIMAGSGCESTIQTIEMSKKMAKCGADCLLVVTPSYFKGQMTNEALINHFTRVADQSPVPIILYNVPANTGIDMSWEVAVRLSKHPNIIGMKESNGDIAKIGRIVYETKGEDFQMMAGSAGFLLGSLHVGAVGGVSALANVLPNEVVHLHRLFKEGKFKEASELQESLIGPNAAVTKQFGVPGLKKAMNWFGYYGGEVRAPLLALSKEKEQQMMDIFNAYGYEP